MIFLKMKVCHDISHKEECSQVSKKLQSGKSSQVLQQLQKLNFRVQIIQKFIENAFELTYKKSAFENINFMYNQLKSQNCNS